MRRRGLWRNGDSSVSDKVSIVVDLTDNTRDKLFEVARKLRAAKQEAEAAQAPLARLERTLADNASTLMKVKIAATAAIGAYAAAAVQITRTGLQFNETVEQAQIGIASIFRQFDKIGKYKSFRNAFDDAAKAIDILKQKAIESPATFEQLVSSWQAVAGAMASANLSVKEQIDLVVRMSQTLAGLGIPTQQLIQESRAIITGQINNSAMAARILQITGADISKQRAQGTLFEFLMAKTRGFGEASEYTMKTVTGLKSNIQDLFSIIAAEAARASFDKLKEGLRKFYEGMSAPEFKAAMLSLTKEIGYVLARLIDLANWAVRHPQLIVTSFKAIAGAAVALAAALGLLAARGGLLALGTVLSSIFGLGAVGSAAGAFRAIGAALGVVASKAGPVAVVLGTVERVIRLGVEQWRLWKIRADEALRLDDLKRYETAMVTALQKRIELARAAGLLTDAEAQAMQGRVRTAGAQMESGVIGASDAATLLNANAKRLVALQAGRGTTKAGEPRTAEEITAIITGASKFELERIELDRKLLDDNYDKKLIGLDDYLRVRREMVEESFREETAIYQYRYSTGTKAEKIDADNAIRLARAKATAEYVELDLYAEKEGQKAAELKSAIAAERRAGSGAVLIEQLRREDMLLEDSWQRRLIGQGAYLDRKADLIKSKHQAELDMIRGQMAESEGAERERYEQQIALKEEQLATELSRLKLVQTERTSPVSVLDHLRIQMQDVASQWGSMAQQMATTITQTVVGAITGLSQALANVIVGTQTAAQAFGQFALQMATQFIASIIQMIIWAKIALPILYALGVLSGGATAATGAAVVGTSLASGAAALASYSRAEGGVIPGAPSRRDNRLAMVATGEYVIQSDAVRHYGVQFFDQLNRMRLPYGSGWYSGFASGGLVPPAGNDTTVNVSPAPVDVVVLDSEAKLAEYLKGRKGRAVVYDILSGLKGEIGIRT